MKKIVIGAVTVAVAGAAGFGLTVYPQMRAKQEVDKLFASLPKSTEGHYKAVDYSLFSNKLVVTGIEVKSTEGKSDFLQIGSFEVDKADFDAQRLVFDPASYKNGARDPQHHNLAKALIATDIKVGTSGATFTLGRLTVSDLAAKQFETAPPASLSDLMSDANQIELNKILAYSRLEMQDYGIQAQGTLSVKVASMTASDLKDGHLGALQGKGMTAEDSATHMQMAIAEISGEKMEYAKGKPFTFTADGETKTIPGVNVGRMALTGISFTTPETKTVTLKEIVLADYAQQELVPTSMTLGIHGLAVDPQAITDQEAKDMLAQLGYDKLALDFDLSFVHAVDSQRLSIRKAAIGADTAGRLTLTADLGGIPQISPSNPAVALAAAQTATLEKLELRYEDASLANRVIKMMAKEQQVDEAAMKAGLIESLNEQKAAMAHSPISVQAVDSIIAFLGEPKSLTVKAQPAQPVALQQLMTESDNPDSLADAVKLTVSANK